MNKTKSKTPSVLIVEDQQLLRLGISLSLEKEGCCRIVGAVGDGESAIREVHRLRPEVVLMDVGLPGMNGIDATWKLKHEFPQTRVLMFTSHTFPEDITAALGAGADGYCIKDASIDQISRAINAIMCGETWLDPAIADVVLQHHSEQNAGSQALSDLETRVLSLIQEGVENQKIADRLNTSTELVARVMYNIIHRFVEERTIVTASSTEKRIEDSEEWLAAREGNISGTIFEGKYLIEDILGSGGCGSVFKAKHVYMNRPVALKLMHPTIAEDRLAMRHFQREAIAICNVRHKNILEVYDFGISENREPYLVMEYIEGISLGDILKNEHRLPSTRLIPLCEQVCDGLSEAHSKGIIHCDLKPSNLLIVGQFPNETVKLVDFGLAQMLPVRISRQSQITDRHSVFGTPLYMSPEQCQGKTLDPRSDIYSLGCLLYEALTGKNVFLGENAFETFANHCQLIPPPMSMVFPAGVFSSQLENCVSRMLAKNPSHRLQSMKEVRTMLVAV